ncbi:MAG: response regulator transcription factor [Gemmatimonadetes bacterium]|nr:response regulator transcription factor [Gemmatimonadota bacterium]MCA9768946.1 response regulator transcription factor [Gemmatimonadota bacterium]MCB9518264.1 response regulator transcription factor [Gemmatimonadales bacterium]HPF62836.1 response regulator transcription factor [Gemmatimonadales bacterium]HRX19751.1 response regulator transcription factor [Gemmatimonadales bacterium]
MPDPATLPVVLHAEDEPLIRSAVSRILSGHARQLEPVSTLRELDQAVRVEREFDVLVVDLIFGSDSALPLLRRSLKRDPGLRVLVLSGFDGPAIVQQCLSAGVAGFVSKLYAFEELVEAVIAVHAGRRFVSPRCSAPASAEVEALAGLGARSLRILDGLRRRLTHQEIADLEGVSCKTVEYHARKLGRALGIDGQRGGWELGGPA